MSPRTRQAVFFLGTAVLLGVAADVLMSNLPGRVGLAAWMLVSLLAGLALWRSGVVRVERPSVVLAMLAVPFILALVFRDSEALLMLNMLAAVTCIVLAAPKARPAELPAAGLANYAVLGASSAGNSLFGALPLAANDVGWAELQVGGRVKPWAAAGIGLVAAAPIVLLFGSLFSQADPLFRRTVDSIFVVNFDPFVEHAARIIFLAWVVAGFLRWSFTGRSPEARTIAGGRAGVTAVVTGLGAVTLLFLLFVAVEARYLFGGDALVRSLTGLSYAEYARRGFFELTWVAGLSVPLLLVADWIIDRSNLRALARFRFVAWVMLLLLGVIVASALYRMNLYTQAYGLTELRFYTTAFMLWLAVILAWLGATVLRGRRSGFAFGALVAGVVAVVVMNMVNPDALIARVNLSHPNGVTPPDADYLSGLSADALPALVAGLPSLPPAIACKLSRKLESRWSHATVKVWDVSRAAAARELAAIPPTTCQAAGG